AVGAERPVAALEHLLHGALEVDDAAIRRELAGDGVRGCALAAARVECRHVLVRALEGDRVEAGQDGELGAALEPRLRRARDERALGRVAGDLPAALPLAQRRIVAEKA